MSGGREMPGCGFVGFAANIEQDGGKAGGQFIAQSVYHCRLPKRRVFIFWQVEDGGEGGQHLIRGLLQRRTPALFVAYGGADMLLELNVSGVGCNNGKGLGLAACRVGKGAVQHIIDGVI